MHADSGNGPATHRSSSEARTGRCGPKPQHEQPNERARHLQHRNHDIDRMLRRPASRIPIAGLREAPARIVDERTAVSTNKLGTTAKGKPSNFISPLFSGSLRTSDERPTRSESHQAEPPSGHDETGADMS